MVRFPQVGQGLKYPMVLPEKTMVATPAAMAGTDTARQAVRIVSNLKT
jgi:hypothetical protein